MASRILKSLGLVFLLTTPALPQQPLAASCAEDVHIAEAKRKMIETAAVNFTQAVIAPSGSDGFGFLSKAAAASVQAQQFDELQAAIRRMEPKNVTVQHTYFISLKGDSPGRVVCGSDLSKPNSWESLQAVTMPEQAYTLLSAETVNNKLAIATWLVREESHWKINDFRVNVATLGDKDSMQLFELAQAQETKKHSFNAALLYAAAGQTANRGSSFQLGITQSISEATSKLLVPEEVRGQPPFLWKSGERTYKVTNVGPISIAGKLYVIIAHEVEPWQTNEQVDGWNKSLLTYFKARFPEYADVFAGLVARATERGSNRGYGTVEETPLKN